jgi:hypothetical protein
MRIYIIGDRLRQLGAVRVYGAGACRRAPCNEGALAAVGSTLIELAFPPRAGDWLNGAHCRH